MKRFAALVSASVTVLTMSLILYGICFHGPGETLGVLIVLYLTVMVVNSTRLICGAATDIVQYDHWKDRQL